MLHSVAPINAAVCNKARRPLGCRQCAEHEGREEHKGEERGFCPLSIWRTGGGELQSAIHELFSRFPTLQVKKWKNGPYGHNIFQIYSY